MSVAAPDGRWVAVGEQQGHLLEAWLASPDEGRGKTAPLVLMYPEIFGVNEAMRRTARMFADEAGAHVLVPDIFSHQERRVDLDYGPESRQRGFALMQGLDIDLVVEESRHAVAWAQAHVNTNGKVAVIGFCIGGLIAIRFAAAAPCDAVASFYGVKVDEHPGALRAIRCPVQYHVGEADAHIPMAKVAAIRQEAATLPGLKVFTYPEAGHGFFNPWRSDVFDPAAFEAAKNRVLQMLSGPGDRA